MINYINKNNQKIAVVSCCKINSLNDVLDIIATAYHNGSDKIIVPRDVLCDDFFNLRTGIAGEILQKFSNYGVKLAIIGDFDNIKGALRDFIYECNSGIQIFFKKTDKESVLALC